MKTIVENFQINARRAGANADLLALKMAAKQFGIPARDGIILSRSIDSRRRDPMLIYKILFESGNRFSKQLRPATPDEIARLTPAELELPSSRLMHPIVIGSGPAGVFGALALALAGCKPIILDRGAAVEQRAVDHEKFLTTRILNEESNLLIGEGGAGTFSDGKLYTGTKDFRSRFVIETFASAGAPDEIRYHARAHIGSDYLKKSCIGLRKKIIDLGGEFIFNAHVITISPSGNHGLCVKLASGDVLETPAILLAPGLGGRQLVRDLAAIHGGAELKPFQIGCRIEHPQELIDHRQYHGSRPEALGAAEYHLNHSGISSFCMCPGGTLVNASAWQGHSCTNGMSLFARDGAFSNAALIATLQRDEIISLDNAFAMIDNIEQKIFKRGGADYTFPAQDAAAFLNGRGNLSRKSGSAETGYIPGRVDDLLPERVRNAIAGALPVFDRKIPGFIRHGVIVGIESCVSSPLRLVKNEDNTWSGLRGVYPAGEGTGSAGGIVSAACDGIRAAEAMLKNNSANHC